MPVIGDNNPDFVPPPPAPETEQEPLADTPATTQEPLVDETKGESQDPVPA
jgi:hypothetical protein